MGSGSHGWEVMKAGFEQASPAWPRPEPLYCLSTAPSQLSRVFSEKCLLVDSCGFWLPSSMLSVSFRSALIFLWKRLPISPRGLGGRNHTHCPVGWAWPIRATVTSSEMGPCVGSTARPGTSVGTVRERNLVSDGAAKPRSQFWACVWSAYLRMVPGQDKGRQK